MIKRVFLITLILTLLLFPLSIFAQTLTWTDNSGGAATGSNIYRAPATVSGSTVSCPTTGYVKIAAISSLSTYRDTAAAGSPAVCYYVTSFNGLGESLPSNVQSFIVPLKPPTLNVIVAVSISGPGAGGTIVSSPNGIAAMTSGTYTAQFLSGTQVTLTATPKWNGSRFAGWTGACSGTFPICNVKLVDANVNIGARFQR